MNPETWEQESQKQSIEGTCPDCRGPLSVVRTGPLIEIRCLVGHRYSPESLLAAHAETVEKALWSATVALKEEINLIEAVADRLPPDRLEALRAGAGIKFRHAAEIQKMIETLEPFDPFDAPSL